MSNLRISGIASGFDTDQMIKDLMKVEKMKVDRVEKQRKVYEYTQESYRAIIDQVRGDFSNYFDPLKPTTNLRSSNSFSQFNYSVLQNAVASTKVSVTANTSITNFNHTITEISQLATKDTWSGTNSDIKGIKTSAFDIANLKTALGASDFKMILSINGVSKTIDITNAEITALTDTDGLVAKLNTEIQAEFGADYSNVVQALDTNGDLINDDIEFDMAANTVKILNYTGYESTLTGLGIASGTSNFDFESKPISELFDFTGIDVTAISINGTSTLGILETDTLDEMMAKIKSAGINVDLTLNKLDETFSLKATKEGSAYDISLDDANTTGFFSLLGIDGGGRVSGKNAMLTLDGVNIVQGSNVFTTEGVTYTLKSTLLITDNPIEVSVTKDTNKIVETIKGFVEQYNSLIEEVNAKLNEKKYYDYKPLTDEEITALSEDEVKIWKAKASSGLLRNSSELESMVSRMRTAIYEAVEGVGITLDQIGIKSSNDYREKGKLIIDEDKLNTALDTNFDEVVSLFSNESDKDYLDTTNATERYQENGIANRLYDIIQDNVRLTRDTSGKKGILLEKAGLVGDITQAQNTLQTIIDGYNNRMDDLLDMLSDKEEAYYTMFSKMESALSELQAQSSSFMSQLGSN